MSKRIKNIYSKLLQRFPKTYIKPSLIIYPSLIELQESYKNYVGEIKDKGDPGHPPYAFASNDFIIHLPRCIIHRGKEAVLDYLLHEYGHLFALNKYGGDDLRWKDYKRAEDFANRFAKSWLERLKKTGWFKKI